MRHADDHVLDAELGGALQDLLHRRDHRLAAVEAEALGAGVLQVQEPLKALGLDQPLEDRPLALEGELRLVADALDPVLDPLLLLGMHDVHELDADRPAIGLAQDLQDLAQRRRFQPEHVVDEDRPVEVILGEAPGLGIELGVVLLALQPQGVEVGDEVAAHAIEPDEHQRADGILRRPAGVAFGEQRGPGDAGSGGGDGAPAVAGDQPRRRWRPRRAAHLGDDRPAIVGQLREKRNPARVDRAGIFQVTTVQFRDVGGVGAVQQRLLRYGHPIHAGAAAGRAPPV